MQILSHLLVTYVLAYKHRELLCILQHAGYLYWSWPVHVVETLSKNQLLNDSFFQKSITIQDLVKGRLHSSSVAMLCNQVKLKSVANCFTVYEHTRWRIDSLASSFRKKLLISIFIHQNINQVHFLTFFEQTLKNLLDSFHFVLH